jgi:hypothetical protein
MQSIRNLILLISVLSLALLAPVDSARARDELVDATRTALTNLFRALATGDPDRIRPLLSPEFQVLRSNGVGYDRDAYIAGSIPHIMSEPKFNELFVTRNGSIVVCRMKLDINEIIDGKKVESNAAQLIVFKVSGAEWQVVAAANFARLEK